MKTLSPLNGRYCLILLLLKVMSDGRSSGRLMPRLIQWLAGQNCLLVSRVYSCRTSDTTDRNR